MIHIEPIVVQIRAFDDGKQYGDPYTWTGTGVRVDDGVIEIVGCLTAPTPSIWKQLHRTLKAAGWKQVIFRRHTEDGIKTHTVIID